MNATSNYRSAAASLKLSLNSLTASILLTAALGPAWGAEGEGIVFFNSSNPDRVVFEDKTYSVDDQPGTNRASNTSAEGFEGRTRNALGGVVVGGDLAKPAKVNVTAATNAYDYGVRITNHLTSSRFTPCGATGVCAAVEGNVRINQTCKTKELTITGELTAELANLTGTSTIGGKFNTTWTNGWQSCQGAGEFAGCLGRKLTGSASRTYSTAENRARIRWNRVTVQDTVLYSTRRDYCENTLGGQYNYRRIGQVYKYLCENMRTKPAWDAFVNVPIADGANINTCRTIKDTL